MTESGRVFRNTAISHTGRCSAQCSHYLLPGSHHAQALGHRNRIDGLRFFAFMSVILVHSDVTQCWWCSYRVSLLLVMSCFLITRVPIKFKSRPRKQTIRSLYAFRALQIFCVFRCVSLRHRSANPPHQDARDSKRHPQCSLAHRQSTRKRPRLHPASTGTTRPCVPSRRAVECAASVQVLKTAGVDMTGSVQDIEVWRRKNLQFRASAVSAATLLSPGRFVLED